MAARQATLQAAVEEVEERYFGTVRIRNSTEQYRTVRAVKKSVKIRSISPPPPPHRLHLTRRCDSGDFGRRSNMSDRVAGKDMAT